jgi:hypothetical protein
MHNGRYKHQETGHNQWRELVASETQNRRQISEDYEIAFL